MPSTSDAARRSDRRMRGRQIEHRHRTGDEQCQRGHAPVVASELEVHEGPSGTLYDLSYYQSLCEDACTVFPFLTPTGINKDLPFYLSPSVVTNTQRIFTQEVRLPSVPAAIHQPTQPVA